ncbi:MAG: Lrp/AsnC family transcriptional regulator [Candidatus Hodarchaeota archaeon]
MFPISPHSLEKSFPPLRPLGALQQIDFLILYHLRFNGRMPLSALSKKTKISVSTIRKRLNFMRKNHLIVETTLLNPGSLQKGMMTIFKVEIDPIITTHFRNEIEQKLSKELDEYYWVSWKVVGRPLLLIAFQVNNTNEITMIQNKIITELIPNYKSISSISGGAMHYFPDFRDDLLEEKRNMGWFFPDQWVRED